jgi:G3E family GTPase
MSVSVIAGPASDAVMDWLRASDRKGLAIFEQEAQAQPEEIVARLRAIAKKGEVNHLLIQCEASRPLMAYAFLFADELADVAQLASAAFAIDSVTLLDSLLNRKATSISASFMAEQMEFASDIFLDGAQGLDLELAKSITIALNPRARVCHLAEVDSVTAWIDRLGTTFDFEEAINGAGWRTLLDHDHFSSNDNITAFGYHARRPFHPERFATLLEKGLGGVFRAKGFFWLATRMNEVGGLNLAGSELQCSSAGHWWAARDRQTRESEMPARTRNEWQEPFGDRRQSFALLATKVSQDTLRNQLDGCLLTDDELAGGEQTWGALTDPFPSWAHAHVHDHECDHDHDHDHGSHEHDCGG